MLIFAVALRGHSHRLIHRNSALVEIPSVQIQTNKRSEMLSGG